MLLAWREKQEGIIGPDERLPWGPTLAMGAQHVLAMFGATVVAPLIMGFDANLAILFSGIGTSIFFVVVGGRVPSYLGSSFAFIGPVGAAIGSPGAGNFDAGDIPQALGGIVVAGALYTLIGVLVHVGGSGWVDALMPPLVTGAVVAIIGLNLAGAAKDLASNDPFVAIVTILAIFAVALYTGGCWGGYRSCWGRWSGIWWRWPSGGRRSQGGRSSASTCRESTSTRCGRRTGSGGPIFRGRRSSGTRSR